MVTELEPTNDYEDGYTKQYQPSTNPKSVRTGKLPLCWLFTVLVLCSHSAYGSLMVLVSTGDLFLGLYITPNSSGVLVPGMPPPLSPMDMGEVFTGGLTVPYLAFSTRSPLSLHELSKVGFLN